MCNSRCRLLALIHATAVAWVGVIATNESLIAASQKAEDVVVGEPASDRMQPLEMRTWIDISGKYRTRAVLIKYTNGTVHLRKEDGAAVTLPIERLSAPDREFVRLQGANSTAAATAVWPTKEEERGESAISAGQGLADQPMPGKPDEAQHEPMPEVDSPPTGTGSMATVATNEGSDAASTPTRSHSLTFLLGGCLVAAIVVVAIIVVRRKSGAGETTTAGPLLNAPADDNRVTQAIHSLTAHVKLRGETAIVEGTGADGPVMQAARQFEALCGGYPDNPAIHYAYAAALQTALQGAAAGQVLEQCVAAHPEFWPARITLHSGSLASWNPFLFPEFDPTARGRVHSAIHELVSTNILLTTREGLLPRATLFLRDAGGDFSASVLEKCKIEFTTTISPIRSPQVVAINGRIHDDPADPYQLEVTQCPFRPRTNRDRFVYELFVRQGPFDFVVLDRTGDVKYVRRISPAPRMEAAHRKLIGMFQKEEGTDLGLFDVMDAISRHQGKVDPRKLRY